MRFSRIRVVESPSYIKPFDFDQNPNFNLMLVCKQTLKMINDYSLIHNFLQNEKQTYFLSEWGYISDLLQNSIKLAGKHY